MAKGQRSESFSPLVSSQFSKAPRARQEASVSSKPLPYWDRVSVTNNYYHPTPPSFPCCCELRAAAQSAWDKDGGLGAAMGYGGVGLLGTKWPLSLLLLLIMGE
jgi:hypothetical protein